MSAIRIFGMVFVDTDVTAFIGISFRCSYLSCQPETDKQKYDSTQYIDALRNLKRQVFT